MPSTCPGGSTPSKPAGPSPEFSSEDFHASPFTSIFLGGTLLQRQPSLEASIAYPSLAALGS